MIDYRFTGRIGSGYDYVDVRFRTDAITTSHNFFNITQVQVGPEFTTADKQNNVYQKWFSPLFKETNSSKAVMIQFAMDNDLDLRAYDQNGTESIIFNDDSASLSR